LTKAAGETGRTAGATRNYGSTDRVEQVIQFVLDGVRRGRFAPGQRISEVEVATALGINRAPVREGLRILAGEGVTELVPNRGARIRRLNRDDLREMVHVLNALNDLSIGFIVEKHDSAAIDAALTPIIDRIQKAASLRSHPAVLEAIEDYHRGVHDLGANKYILYLWNRLHVEHYHRSFAIEFPEVDWDWYLVEFAKAHEALVARDVATASRLFAQRAHYVSAVFDGDSAKRLAAT